MLKSLMKKILWLIIIAALILVFYRIFSNQPAEPAAPTPIIVPLAAMSDSGESGEAIFEEVDGQVRVMVELVGAPRDVSQPAHLHKGSCGAPGEQIYTLSSVSNGASETILTVSLAAIADNLPLALNVHKSAAEINVYVACGEVMNED